VPFKKTEQQLLVYCIPLDALTAIQRQSLRKALEGLLRKIGREAQNVNVDASRAGP